MSGLPYERRCPASYRRSKDVDRFFNVRTEALGGYCVDCGRLVRVFVNKGGLLQMPKHGHKVYR